MVKRFSWLFFCLLFSVGITAKGGGRQYNSYKGLVMAGYQGWFNTPDDGSGRGWHHYNGPKGFRPGSCSIDFWPEVSEYKKLYKTEFTFEDGKPASVFSSYDESTVELHFKWMNQYGLDGVFMQRFVSEIRNESGLKHFNKVLNSAMKAANKYERAICVMYDLSGMKPGEEGLLLKDIAEIARQYSIKDHVKNPSYLYHNGKPLVTVWGVGFNDNRRYGLKEAERIIDGLKLQGFSVMLGVPTQWRELKGDTESDPHLHQLIRKCDIVMPWFVGRYNENTYPKFQKMVEADIQWAKKNQVDYAPLVFPGFSWGNMKGQDHNSFIPRNKGSFLWKQLMGAIRAGAEMIYVAMFDEVDEGTAIFKCAKKVPVGESIFIPVEEEVESDHYLKLVGEAGKILRKEKAMAFDTSLNPSAPNPFIRHMYTADPSAHVWKDGRLYVYASHDIAPPHGCDLMDRYHVFSTDDMVHWTDHGEILNSAQVSWGRKEGGFMWAPDCAYKNGTYYFYFPHPSGTNWNDSWKIGVATSRKPAEGFKVKGYIEGMDPLIDPCVFVDDDGQAYIYNGGGGLCKGGKLKDNMMELDGPMQTMEGLEDFHEATWIHKYNGKYYLSYSDNHDENWNDGVKGDNRMRYAVSDSPLGPWESKGIYMEPTDSYTNHGSIVEFKGQWYAFYHNSALSNHDWLRSICVDKLYHNPDGTIKLVKQTKSTPITVQKRYPFRNPQLSIEQRVDDLVSRLTLEEKVRQMLNNAPAIKRLGIPAYNWWNECLHGVGRTKYHVTVFPQAIGMAASWNDVLMKEVASSIADEGRAIYNDAQKRGDYSQYHALTYWTPNINIFRDPRWGRGQETYGEDPYLTSKIGKAFVLGLQGDDPRYLKASACAKHYAVHSGPEKNRHSFNSDVSTYDLWDTYLPAFRTLVVDANVSGVMCAYNAFKGQPCCGNDLLMQSILRDKWNFKGYVTSDCGAIDDIFNHHKAHPDAATAAADAVFHGTDLDCGQSAYLALVKAVKNGIITEKQLDVSVKRLFTIRFRLGLFDPAEQVDYAHIPISVLECKKHQDLAKQLARESMVLLKNDRLLPLQKNKLKKVVVMGPNADCKDALLGNYNGHPSRMLTPLQAIRERLKGVAEVVYVSGIDYINTVSEDELKRYVNQAKGADAVIFIGGISPRLEGEEMSVNKDGFDGGDRTSIALPTVQTQLMKALVAGRIPTVFVMMTGSALAIPWEAKHVPAILNAWYGGQHGREAIADVLFGDYNPSGKLPVTFYAKDSDLPDFESYDMQGRTYRYFKGKALYPFGYGLSYTDFRYSSLKMPTACNTTDKEIPVTVTVKNTGKMDGEEVVQLYVSHPDKKILVPVTALKGFKRIYLKAGEAKQITFSLSSEDLSCVDENGIRKVLPGTVKIQVGGCSPVATLTAPLKTVETALKLTGDTYTIDK